MVLEKFCLFYSFYKYNYIYGIKVKVYNFCEILIIGLLLKYIIGCSSLGMI